MFNPFDETAVDPNVMKIKRFALLFLAACCILHGVISLAADTSESMPVFRDGNRILFQGDSITDGNRGRSVDPNHILGHGYSLSSPASMEVIFPNGILPS